jgi:Protein of unknown function (DUF3800)
MAWFSFVDESGQDRTVAPYQVLAGVAINGCKLFASMVDIDAPKTSAYGLRKDYGYLFERFFYFLEDYSSEGGIPHHGVFVFDELEKTRSHILMIRPIVILRKQRRVGSAPVLLFPNRFLFTANSQPGYRSQI